MGRCTPSCRGWPDWLAQPSGLLLPAKSSDPDLPLYYAACDLFVLPANARAEAFGTVIVEALAAGKPVISTEVGTGTSWVNVDGETGLVVPPHDPAALANAVNQVLTNTELRLRMGHAARARAEMEFTVERMIDRVYAEYEALLKLRQPYRVS